jgi:hypothetical protein
MGNHRIQMFRRNGDYISEWGTYGSQDGRFQEPYSITISSGVVYVGEWQGQRIQSFDLGGAFLLNIDVASPVSAVAVSDTTIFALANDRAVLRYSLGGNLLDTVYAPGKMSDGMTDIQINSLSISPDGDAIYLSDLSQRRILSIDFTGALVLRFCLEPMNEGAPQDVVALADGALLVARYGGHYEKYGLP